jgi:hypothetical protein
MVDPLDPFNKMVIIGSTCLTRELTRILKLFFFFQHEKLNLNNHVTSLFFSLSK